MEILIFSRLFAMFTFCCAFVILLLGYVEHLSTAAQRYPQIRPPFHVY